MIRILSTSEPLVVLEWDDFENLLKNVPTPKLLALVANETGDPINDLKGMSRKNLIDHLFQELEG